MEIKPDQVLLTGGRGLLGTELCKLEPKLLATDLEEFDVTDPDQMADFLAGRLRPATMDKDSIHVRVRELWTPSKA